MLTTLPQNGAAPGNPVLREQAAANYLGVSPRTLQRWRQTGEGPAYVRLTATKIGYRATALDAFADSRTFVSLSAEGVAQEHGQ